MTGAHPRGLQAGVVQLRQLPLTIDVPAQTDTNLLELHARTLPGHGQSDVDNDHRIASAEDAEDGARAASAGVPTPPILAASPSAAQGQRLGGNPNPKRVDNGDVAHGGLLDDKDAGAAPAPSTAPDGVAADGWNAAAPRDRGCQRFVNSCGCSCRIPSSAGMTGMLA
jgi:hypothetical protein